MNLKISTEYLESILNVYDDLFKDLDINNKTDTVFFDNVELSKKDLKYYISSSTLVLKNALYQAFKTQEPDIIYSTLEVFNYLVYPKDILPDNELYLLGYLDDVWLIHNYVNYSFDNYTFSLEGINVDWCKINNVSTTINNYCHPKRYKRLHQKMRRVINLQ